MIDVEEEITKLREYLEKPHKFMGDDIRAGFDDKLSFIEDNELGAYRMFSATLQYGATGEGHTTAFVAHAAHSKRAFMNYLIQKMDGYWFVIGMGLYEGMPVDDGVYDHLFSKAMQAEMSRLPHFETYLWHHYNFS